MTSVLESETQRGQRIGERTVVAAMLRLAAIPKDNWEDSIQQILQVDSQVLRVDRVSYWSVRKHPTLIHCEMGFVAGLRGFERGATLLASEQPRYFAEISRPTVVDVEDAEHDPRMSELQEYLRARQIASLLDVPVWTRGVHVGVLCHEHTGGVRHWSDSDVDFAVAIAHTVAAALEAHARGRAEQEWHRSAFLDQSLLRLTTAARNPNAVAQEAMAIAVPELADGAFLDVLEEGGLTRVGIAHRSDRGRAALEEISRRHPPRPDGEHPVAQVMRLRQSVLIPQFPRAGARAGDDADESRMFERLGVRSAMAIPLLAGDRVLGVMQFHASERQFDQGDLRLAEDFVERLAVALENARLHERAETAIRARDEFIAVAAHELHGPLTSLQLSAESLAASVVSTPEGCAKMSSTVVRQTQRLNRLVDHMLDASRVMTKRLSLVVTEVDLSKLVHEIASSFIERSQKAGSALSLHIEPGICGYWDADRLAQVVSNVLDNAIKFGAGKAVDVSLHTEADQAVLRVSDHGIGVPQERIDSLFDPFVRAVSPRRFGGLGLGLFLTKAIIDAHGGEIEVRSRPAEGSTFIVRLRRGRPPAPEEGDGDAE